LASQVSWAASLSRFARGRGNRHGKAIFDQTRDLTFKPAEMVDIGDDALARRAQDRRGEGHAAGRHVDDLTGKFAPVGQHIAAEQVDLDALMPAAFFGPRHNSRFDQWQGHGDWHFRTYSRSQRP